jgi:hypothetical protein
VAQAALDYCASALEHELRRQAGYRFEKSDFQRKQDGYDRFKLGLSGPSMTTEDDFHEFLDRFILILHPEKAGSWPLTFRCGKPSDSSSLGRHDTSTCGHQRSYRLTPKEPSTAGRSDQKSLGDKAGLSLKRVPPGVIWDE